MNSNLTVGCVRAVSDDLHREAPSLTNPSQWGHTHKVNMPKDKNIIVKYSKNLDLMTKYINEWFENNSVKSLQYIRAERAVRDFCYRYPREFKKLFFDKCGIRRRRLPDNVVPPDISVRFSDALEAIDGECIFLLRDTHEVMSRYTKMTDKGFGILISRMSICKGESQYFDLIEIFYKSLNNSSDIYGFLDQYKKYFATLIESDESMMLRARDIYEYVKSRNTEKKVVFVDLGFQFTFSLFCYGSVDYFSNDSIIPDFYSLTTYPWLIDRFEQKVFSTLSEAVLPLEMSGRKAFQNSLSERGSGAIAGFAIGDAMGYPVAGVEAGDISSKLGLSTPITNFVSSPRHPFFASLERGQFTSNTIVLKIVAETILRHNAYSLNSIAAALVGWGEVALDNRHVERWLGPTTREAVRRLVSGIAPGKSGVETSRSCASAYRAVPLGLYYRPFVHGGLAEAVEAVEECSKLTHAHPASVAGSLLIWSIIGDLTHGTPPKTAVRAAINLVPNRGDTRLLYQRARLALSLQDDERARRALGTGSPIEQTVPLAIYFFLKYASDFDYGVRQAANSYRSDTKTERKRLASYPFEQALVEAKGGNTDGIAGLVGALIGTHIGENNIPAKFRTVEDFSKLSKIGANLVK